MTPFRARFATTAALVAALTFAPVAVAGASPSASPSARASDRASDNARAPGVTKYFGAISLGSDARIGYARDYRSRRAAITAANQLCRQRSRFPATCTSVGWMRNACGAVSVRYRPDGSVHRYQFAWGTSPTHASREARRGFGGQIRTAICTTR